MYNAFDEWHLKGFVKLKAVLFSDIDIWRDLLILADDGELEFDSA
jgi:hypothetical protein